MTPISHAPITPHLDYPSLPLTFEGYSVRGNKYSIKSNTSITPHDYPSNIPMRGNIPYVFRLLGFPLTQPPPYGGGFPLPFGEG
jgi:hypothetical protein